MTQLHAVKTNKEIFALFVDLTAAFDHINRNWLFQTIRNRLADDKKGNKIINILENLYKQTNVESPHEPRLNFQTTSVVRQGRIESPLLFNLYLDYVMRVFFENCKEQNIKFPKFDFRITDAARQNRRLRDYQGNTENRGSGYADDIELFFHTAEDLQRAVTKLESLFEQFGLNINAKKTVTMIINFKGEDKNYPQSICSLGNLTLDNVKRFKYLA